MTIGRIRTPDAYALNNVFTAQYGECRWRLTVEKSLFVQNLKAFESGIWKKSREKQIEAKLYQLSLIYSYGHLYLDNFCRADHASVNKLMKNLNKVRDQHSGGDGVSTLPLFAARDFITFQIQRLQRSSQQAIQSCRTCLHWAKPTRKPR